MFFLFGDEMEDIERIIREGAESAATIPQIIEIEIGEWKNSKKLKWMRETWRTTKSRMRLRVN
ncbi:hypothetical protein M5W83_25735 [Paenibacillus thiaminolyticus]|uniref:Uncharacterized protein n=1 Tax=Paenibacillus thiaminolyticus TaxID=49283 RepID=A0ABT4G3A5_PANTH|nr:hypothetical protein [Paenibacillus thiaminolyticus]MCY9534516.1 hypothetical protein [Paenibacillus thiaminolyticus]MCY9604587.1 hypothetical protein [Paenibacillus thiaminolyticus]MCY9610554.1 hypothetical protein [Paenibacillus thiaminolyticus]MCY9614044.1 hypothetical protein [Paenibacillus thiaminolyticus]MCY9618581.1 hypothetical protein [Paenibacillus thiaminolyticus]